MLKYFHNRICVWKKIFGRIGTPSIFFDFFKVEKFNSENPISNSLKSKDFIELITVLKNQYV
jgi:hypothetical protein